MSYPINYDNSDSVKNYFDSLPEYMRENIKQSGVTFDNVDDLKKYAENMGKSHN